MSGSKITLVQQHIVATTSSATPRVCFICATPMPSSTALIGHLENSHCSSLPNPAFLTLCLGKSWYSPLYMDLDLHAQIRRNEIDLKETTSWMEQGFLRPFTCRKKICESSFARFSELVAHVESGNCVWGIEKLRLDMLGVELAALVRRKDSAVAA